MELFNKIKTFLTSNHLWMRIYKPHELSDPIAKAITESGNETSKILKDVFSRVSSIKGEQGDKGDKGDKGDRGEKGEKGDRGESIRGEKGDRGVNGKDGKDGYTPVKNVDYFDGKDGKDGADGYSPKKGHDYFTKKEIGEIVKLASEKASIAKQTVYSLWQRAIGVKNLDDVDLTAPTNGQALTYSNGKWVNSTVSGGSGSPGGSDTQVQFNDGGAFGGDAGMTYNKTTNALTVGDVLVDDEAYDATNWNGSLEVPTKNAVRDKIEAILSSSGITRTVTVTSGNYTAGSSASTDYIYLIAGAHTTTLPTASGNSNRYTFKNNHSANVTINRAGTDTIDGATSVSLAQEESIDLISNGTNAWSII